MIDSVSFSFHHKKTRCRGNGKYYLIHKRLSCRSGSWNLPVNWADVKIDKNAL